MYKHLYAIVSCIVVIIVLSLATSILAIALVSYRWRA